MRDLAKSIGSATWALSLLGARQLGAFLSLATWARPESAAAPFDAVGRSAREQLGNTLGSTFETGDRLQRGMVDAMFSLLGPLDPQRLASLGNEWLSGRGGRGDCAGCGDDRGGGWGPMPRVDDR